jgi:heme/copper-type cytochrome/quinol oxidase subunit 4
MNRDLTSRVSGYLFSLVLTLIAYYIIINPANFSFDNNSAVIVVFVLALIQSLIQLIFFINVWKEEGGELWNLGVFASTVSIIFIIIFFSILIINHLNYHMH